MGYFSGRDGRRREGNHWLFNQSLMIHFKSTILVMEREEAEWDIKCLWNSQITGMDPHTLWVFTSSSLWRISLIINSNFHGQKIMISWVNYQKKWINQKEIICCQIPVSFFQMVIWISNWKTVDSSFRKIYAVFFSSLPKFLYFLNIILLMENLVNTLCGQ